MTLTTIAHTQALGACTWSSPVKVEACGAMATVLDPVDLERVIDRPVMFQALGMYALTVLMLAAVAPKSFLSQKLRWHLEHASTTASFKQRSLNPDRSASLPKLNCAAPARLARTAQPSTRLDIVHEDHHLACSN